MGYFTLSSGEYSDYGITGLYTSDFEMTFEKLKELRVEYAVSMGLDRIVVKNQSTLDDYYLQKIHNESLLRDFIPQPYRTNNDEYEFVINHPRYVKFNFIEWLLENNYMKEIEYDEFNVTEDCE